jgi:hypothetical protein
MRSGTVLRIGEATASAPQGAFSWGRLAHCLLSDKPVPFCLLLQTLIPNLPTAEWQPVITMGAS